ncbi:uncharacterized protein [Lolium perenne]|uniref:uncharacterized protein n=1 Tax=Lolium perenne TaxID=4522 RepID=UPI003A994B01
MAPFDFDLNQPINWVEEEEEIVEDQYDDRRCTFCPFVAPTDKLEEHVYPGHGGGAAGQADSGGDGGDVADGQQGCHHGDFAGDVVAVSHANGYRGGAHGKGGGLDLNKIANTRRRTQYTDDERRAIYSMLLKRSGGSTVRRGVSKAVAAEMEMPVRTVQRIWLVGRRGGGIDAVVGKRAKNCGRKRIELDPDAILELPMDRGMSIQELAKAMRMKKTTVFRRLKEGSLRRPRK